ncbi:hypothetical protein Tco_0016915 [Tanacetum coccineum]
MVQNIPNISTFGPYVMIDKELVNVKRNVNDEFNAYIVISFLSIGGEIVEEFLYGQLKEVVKKFLSLQSLSSPSESLLYLEVEASLFLNVLGLHSGVLFRTIRDMVTGQLSNGRSRFCYVHQGHLRLTPVSYETHEYAAFFSAEQGAEGVVAVAGDALKKKVLVTIESDHGAFSAELRESAKKECFEAARKMEIEIDGDDDDTLFDQNQINGFLAFELLTQSQHVFWSFKMSRLSAYACTVNFHDNKYGTLLAVCGYNKRSNLCRRRSRVHITHSPQSSMILPADHVLRAVINARLPVPLLLLVCFWSYLFHVVMASSIKFGEQCGAAFLIYVSGIHVASSNYWLASFFARLFKMTNFAVKHSIMTPEIIENFCNDYYIPDEVHPVAPGWDKTITQFPEGEATGEYESLLHALGYSCCGWFGSRILLLLLRFDGVRDEVVATQPGKSKRKRLGKQSDTLPAKQLVEEGSPQLCLVLVEDLDSGLEANLCRQVPLLSMAFLFSAGIRHVPLYTDAVLLLEEKDLEILRLKSLLVEEAERAETAEVVRLRGQVSALTGEVSVLKSTIAQKDTNISLLFLVTLSQVALDASNATWLKAGVSTLHTACRILKRMRKLSRKGRAGPGILGHALGRAMDSGYAWRDIGG